MYQMFYYAEAFNQDIRAWETGAVTDMSFMFYGAQAFDRASKWDMNKAANTENMLYMWDPWNYPP